MGRALRIGFPRSYDTQFPADQNPISEGGRWLVGGTTGFYQSPRSLSGLCFGAGTASGYDDCLGQLQSPSLGNDHRVEVTVHKAGGYTPPDSHEIGLYLRINIGAEFVTAYECLHPFDGGGGFQIIRWLGLNHTDLDNFDLTIDVTTMNGGLGTISDGDVLASQIVGSTIKCFKNGTQFAEATDANLASGKPGIGFFIRPGGTPSSFCISRYRALVAT